MADITPAEEPQFVRKKRLECMRTFIPPMLLQASQPINTRRSRELWEHKQEPFTGIFFLKEKSEGRPVRERCHRCRGKLLLSPIS